MGINWIIRNLRILRNPFQNTTRNKKFPNSANLTEWTYFIQSKHETTSCFDISIGCFLKKLENGFETDILLLCGLKLNPGLPKTHIRYARTISKFDWPFENLSTVFTR